MGQSPLILLPHLTSQVLQKSLQAQRLGSPLEAAVVGWRFTNAPVCTPNSFLGHSDGRCTAPAMLPCIRVTPPLDRTVRGSIHPNCHNITTRPRWSVCRGQEKWCTFLMTGCARHCFYDRRSASYGTQSLPCLARLCIFRTKPCA